jgi:hypothetical protein
VYSYHSHFGPSGEWQIIEEIEMLCRHQMKKVTTDDLGGSFSKPNIFLGS